MTRMRRSAGTSRARRGRARRKIPLTSTSVWASAAGRSMCATSGAPAPARAAATCSLVSIHGAPCFVRVCRCAATVVELGHGEVKVSYVGWGQEWDEWRKMRPDEIQRTKPASASNATRPAAARLEPVQKALPGKAGAKRKATHVYAPTHFGHYRRGSSSSSSSNTTGTLPACGDPVSTTPEPWPRPRPVHRLSPVRQVRPPVAVRPAIRRLHVVSAAAAVWALVRSGGGLRGRAERRLRSRVRPAASVRVGAAARAPARAA